MGECGCGDFQPSAAFKVGEKYLAIEEYHGCDYCNAGLAVSVYLMTPQEAGEWGVDEMDVKELKPDICEPVHVPLIGAEELVKAAKVLEEEYDDGEADEDPWFKQYRSLAELMEDVGLELLQEAMRQREWTVKGRVEKE